MIRAALTSTVARIFSTVLIAAGLTFLTSAAQQPESSRSATEAALISALREFKAEAPRSVAPPARDSLVLEIDSLYRLPGGSFFNDAITADLIFDYDFDDKEFFLVDDPQYADATLQNLFCGTVPEDFPIRLQLRVLTQKYGSEARLDLSLEDLLGYAVGHGFKPYWGLEELGEDSLRGSLFIVDDSAGIVHLFRLEGNTAELESTEMTLSGRAYLFIPINNVANLFSDQP